MSTPSDGKNLTHGSQQPLQPVVVEIQQAFADGLAELIKEGASLEKGGYQIIIQRSGTGWEMKYSLIPRKMSGDRLLLIQGRSVQVVPLF